MPAGPPQFIASATRLPMTAAMAAGPGQYAPMPVAGQAIPMPPPAQASLPGPQAGMAPVYQQMLPQQPEQPATIQHIIHPGHEPRQDDELVALIVTICSGIPG